MIADLQRLQALNLEFRGSVKNFLEKVITTLLLIQHRDCAERSDKVIQF
jgi:hypothetical protein